MHRRAFALSGLLAAAGPFVPRAFGASSADTPATRQTVRYLEIMRGPQDDDAVYKALVEIQSPPYPREIIAPLRDQIGGLEGYSFARASETEAELVGHNARTETWTHAVVTVEPAPPHRITRIQMLPGSRRPADVPPPPRLDPAALAAAVRQRAERLMGEDRFAGALLVTRAGQPLVTGAWGLADRQARVPNTLDTQFRFGSMGKMFTAVAVMQLVQAGRLDLKAPLGTYLKDYPNADVARTVTPDHLLTHTGGLGDIFGPEFVAQRQTLREPKDYVAVFGPRPTLFPPGGRQLYSNYGFMLLGRLVEAASGSSYDDYLARNVFGRAAMTATGNAPETTVLPKRAVAYMGVPGQVKSAADTLPYKGTPAGGGYSTVGDMQRFADALMARRLLDEAHVRLLTTGGMTGLDGKLVAYDFRGVTGEGRAFLGHNGGAPGMNGDLRIFPDSDHVVVVLANRDAPASTGMTNFISDRLA